MHKIPSWTMTLLSCRFASYPNPVSHLHCMLMRLLNFPSAMCLGDPWKLKHSPKTPPSSIFPCRAMKFDSRHSPIHVHVCRLSVINSQTQLPGTTDRASSFPPQMHSATPLPPRPPTPSEEPYPQEDHSIPSQAADSERTVQRWASVSFRVLE